MPSAYNDYYYEHMELEHKLTDEELKSMVDRMNKMYDKPMPMHNDDMEY